MQVPHEVAMLVVEQFRGDPNKIVGWQNLPGQLGQKGCVILEDGNGQVAEILVFANEADQEEAFRRLREQVGVLERLLESYELRTNLCHAAREMRAVRRPGSVYQAYCSILVMVPNGTFENDILPL